jgi:hypothetical protein
MELPVTLKSVHAAKFAATSVAVNGSPVFQVTPGRTNSRYSVASALDSQRSSSRPSKVPRVV